jgi:putative peptide zinc metalloprotease protein
MLTHDASRAAADRTVPVRARGDLKSIEVAFGSQTSFVVKDEVAGEAFHLSAEEHRLFRALRQPTSLRGLQRIVESEFAPRQATIQQLQQFINQLYDQGLVISEIPGQGAELLARGEQRRRRSRWSSIPQVLAIRLGGFHSGPLIDRLYTSARWVFTPWALAGALMVVAYAALVIIGNAETIGARLPVSHQFLTLSRLPLWILAIASVKVLHELGHALTCRHFGARPQEMGVLLLAGAPALYCDVSDAWRLPNKWHRMGVSSAGMLVELLIAAAAAIVWHHAAPGMLSAICLTVIMVCSIGTLAVNANPLLRYDGYYILADWLEVPNLAERSRGLISSAWRRWLLAEPMPSDPFVSAGKRRSLWAYAVFSKIYLAFVLACIYLLAHRLAQPYGLENAVNALACVTLAGVFVSPLAAIFRFIADPSVRARMQWRRFGATCAGMACLAVVLWCWPMTRRVEAPLVVVPAKNHPLFAVVGGELAYAAKEGAQVEAGDVIARLTNPEVELALAEQEGIVRMARLRVTQLRALQPTMPAASRVIPAAVAELVDAEAQLVEQQAAAEQLVIRAPVAGRVLAPPPRSVNREAAEKLGPWHGSPLAKRNLGAWIEPGAALAVIEAPGGWVAWAGVDQADVAAVEPGQRAHLLLDEQPMTTLTGHIVHVSRRARNNRRENPDGATASAAGRAEGDDALLGDDRYHVVELALDDSARELFAGARGAARIATQGSTLGQLAWMHVRRLFARVY